jgi:hypothetical protein
LHREPVDDRYRQGQLFPERRWHADADPQGPATASFRLAITLCRVAFTGRPMIFVQGEQGAFASEVPDFGPTQNLWLTHDGCPFEIVTYPTLGPWLTRMVKKLERRKNLQSKERRKLTGAPLLGQRIAKVASAIS